MDVAIVGGGCAGIAAAYTLLGSGSPNLHVTLYEARSTYGGRASTDGTIGGFDRGAGYLQDPSQNPWKKIAEDLKFVTSAPSEGAAVLRVEQNGRWVDEPATTEDVHSLDVAITESYEAALKQPNRVVASKPQFKTLVEHFAQAVSPYGAFSESAETWQYLAADRARQAPDTGYLYVNRGVGTLVRTYGEQISSKFPKTFTEKLNTPVKSIQYDDKTVLLQTQSGAAIHADACIITIPTSVLSSDVIAFSPSLPRSLTDALRYLRLGSYKKLAIGLKSDPNFISPDTDHYCFQNNPDGIWQYFRPSRIPNTMIVHAAGDFASALDCKPDREVLEMFKTTLIEAYPEVSTRLSFSAGGVVTNWNNDRYAQGAYSYTAFAGGAPTDRTGLGARLELRKPVKTLYFAGEASNTDYYGTIAGAYLEGKAAAEAVLTRSRQK